MKPYRLLDAAPIPGGGELQLYEGGDRFSIRLSGCQGELMASRAHASEDALGERACQRIAHLIRPRVLIGGLGMGFTLAAALRTLADRPDAEIVVAELVPGVVAWNQGPLGEVAGHPLRDPRVTVREVDVGVVLRESAGVWDAILLDVDNGPSGLTRASNDGLYSAKGLSVCHRALHPEGVFSVWSAAPDAAFTARLGQAGFAVTEQKIHAHGKKGTTHVLWLSTPRTRRGSSAP